MVTNSRIYWSNTRSIIQLVLGLNKYKVFTTRTYRPERTQVWFAGMDYGYPGT